MNYRDPERLEALTARYVLGTMSRRARRRFKRAFHDDERIADSVYELEEKLLPLAWAQEPVQPSELVWARIARQMNTRTPLARPEKTRWPAVASTLAASLVVALLGWWTAFNQPPEVVIETITETVTETVTLEPAVGVVADAGGNALWVARIYTDLNRANVVVQTPPESQPDNDYELWILRDDGVPFSLGLLPQSGERSLALDSDVVDALTRGNTLAVSLEPPGGSPEAAPTGPVLYTTALLAP